MRYIYGWWSIDPLVVTMFGKDYEFNEVIKVTDLYFSKDGKCELAMEIAEEYLDEIDLDSLDICPDQCFGVSLLPNMFIIKSSDDFDALFLR